MAMPGHGLGIVVFDALVLEGQAKS